MWLGSLFKWKFSPIYCFLDDTLQYLLFKKTLCATQSVAALTIGVQFTLLCIKSLFGIDTLLQAMGDLIAFLKASFLCLDYHHIWSPLLGRTAYSKREGVDHTILSSLGNTHKPTEQQLETIASLMINKASYCPWMQHYNFPTLKFLYITS